MEWFHVEVFFGRVDARHLLWQASWPKMISAEVRILLERSETCWQGSDVLGGDFCRSQKDRKHLGGGRQEISRKQSNGSSNTSWLHVKTKHAELFHSYIAQYLARIA